jgi:hypothetical protein
MTTSTTTASSKTKPCPFCTLPDGRVVEENEFANMNLWMPVTASASQLKSTGTQ